MCAALIFANAYSSYVSDCIYSIERLAINSCSRIAFGSNDRDQSDSTLSTFD